MNRRSFLKWLGLGATVAAAPALAKGAPAEELTAYSQPIVIDQMRNPMLHAMRTKWVSLEEAKEMYPPRPLSLPLEEDHYVVVVNPSQWRDLQWTEQEQAAMRKQALPPLVFNRIPLAGRVSR